MDNGGSKIEQDGVNLKWKEGDKITVDGGATGELLCTNAANGTFEGEITKGSGENIIFKFGDGNCMDQDGTLDDAMYLTSEELEYKADGNYGNVSMTTPYAVLKLDLSALGTATGTTVAITADNVAVASVKNVTNTSTEMYVAMPESSTPKTYCFGDVVTAGVKLPPLTKNTFYTSHDEAGAAIKIDEMAPSKFSVSKTKTVTFSMGNLYWDGEAFHFENSQTAYTTEWNSSHVDRFYWSKTASGAYAKSCEDDGLTNGDIFFTNDQFFQVSGNEAGTWRTLTKDEWDYLLKTRKVGGKTGYLRTTLTDGTSGLIIFPDNYTGATTGLTSIPDGAVFLPAAGGRHEESVYDYGKYSNYWTSTPYLNGKVVYMCSSKDGCGTYPIDARGIDYSGALSVRLVR